MLDKILVPLDGSDLAEKAIPYAIGLAEKFESEMLVVQALPPPPIIALGEFGVMAPDYGPLLEQEEGQAYAYLNRIKQRFDALNIPCRVVVLKDKMVADALVDLAISEEVDVIVKTTHGRSGISGWIYGSVATKVLQRAPCPVFLVRITSADRMASAEAGTVEE